MAWGRTESKVAMPALVFSGTGRVTAELCIPHLGCDNLTWSGFPNVGLR